jgi:hypothetical protein
VIISACRHIGNPVNLGIWLPATLLVGPTDLSPCYVFSVDLEKIHEDENIEFATRAENVSDDRKRMRTSRSALSPYNSDASTTGFINDDNLRKCKGGSFHFEMSILAHEKPSRS